MSKPRLFLHIGHPKTGTTSIQTFLLANRVRLREAGLLYPITGVHDSAHRLFSHAFYSMHHEPNRAPALVRDLQREIQEARCPVVVLSYEGFWLDNPRRFEPLTAVADVTVVYYLRRQDHLAESLYAQEVRSFFDMELRRCDQCDRANAPPLDYARTLRLFAAVFGRDRLAVRRFEPGALHQDHPVLDFLHLLDFPLPAGLTPASSPNTSLKRLYLAFKRHCNVLPFLKEEHRLLIQNLSSLSRQDPAPPLGHILPPQARLRILDRYRDSNAALAREYFGRANGVLFEEPPPASDETWAPLLPLEPDAQRAVFEKLTPENRACLEFLSRPARLALPGEPILPALPDDDPAALERLADLRRASQIQRRLAVLERRLLPASMQ